jgi:hypothetical protein
MPVRYFITSLSSTYTKRILGGAGHILVAIYFYYVYRLPFVIKELKLG